MIEVRDILIPAAILIAALLLVVFGITVNVRLPQLDALEAAGASAGGLIDTVRGWLPGGS